MLGFSSRTRGPMSLVLPALALMLSACVPAVAQTQYSDVPVLVAAEDENRDSVSRSSEIFKRVIGALQEGMYRTGFRIVDEESAAADLGWRISDRRPKTEIIAIAKDMNRSGKASHAVRALFLFRVFAVAEPRGGGSRSRVRVRINGEVYDIVGNNKVGDFEIAERHFPAPAGCGAPRQRSVCITEVVGERARELAADLGIVMATKLEHLRAVSVGGRHHGRVSSDNGERGSVRAVTGDARATRWDGGHTIQIPYTVTLRYFERREALTFIGVMADEFPGYNTHTLLSADQATRRYSYITSAKPHKMEEWLTILLGDMNFDPDKEVWIAIDGTEITIEKIVPTYDRPRSPDEWVRFR